VWAIASPASVLRIDPRTNRITDRIRLVSRSGPDVPDPIAVAAGGGFVWVLAGNTATVTKIDPRTAGVVGTTRIGVDRVPTALAAGTEATWVANADGSLSRIDAASGKVRSILVGRGLRDVGVERDAVWVTNQLTRCCGQE
jgi:DNA-binding beta-propeller fold protein YncE